ncbi:hypothetical protein [Elizabethkingia bruuniana]|uniref:hypothetical protein n=1 Tax=Elizabethkingia bruuniana TaxID=1756149 RepID=UPI00241D4B7E|nr:hypothetical protein [Elizabethkingia bruuniana]
MKKYILSAVAVVAIASCNSPQGGNKNTVKLTSDVERYSDHMEPSETEPNFAPSQAEKPAMTDSTKVSKTAEVKAVKDSAKAKLAAEAKK